MFDLSIFRRDRGGRKKGKKREKGEKRVGRD